MNVLLQPAQHPDAHPDSDQLAAFAEHSLPPHEHAQTLAHLAACPGCRKVVFLAQQAAENEAAMPAPAAPRRSTLAGWFSGWNLAWPAAAALAAMIAVTVHLRSTKVQTVARHDTVARTETPQPAFDLAPAPASPAASAPPPVPLAALRKSAPIVSAPPAAVAGVAAPPAHPTPLTAQPSPPPNSYFQPSPSAAPPPLVSGAVSLYATRNFPAAPAAAGMSLNSAVPAAPRPQPPAAVTLGSGAPVAGPTVPKSAPRKSGSGAPQQAQEYAGAAEAKLAPQAPPPPAQVSQTVTVEASPALSQDSAAQVAAGSAVSQAAPQQVPSAPAPLSQNAAGQSFARAAVVTSRSVSNANAEALPQPPLPSHMPAISSAVSTGRLLTLDTAGTLFLSKDHGQHWKAVKTQWTGRAVRVENAAATTPFDKPTGKPPAFVLTTDKGASWTSLDGQKWTPTP